MALQSTMTSAEIGAKSRHALFSAFHYPPEASSSGVLRTLKYTRFLPDFGWRVSVIAPERDAYDVRDAALEAQVPANAKIVRTRFLNTKRDLSCRGIYPALLALPDVWIGWLPWAVRAARRLVAADPVDLIYSTSPHATAHLIALRIHKTTDKPWVTDFRDPWIEEPPELGTPNGRLYRAINGRLERSVIRHSAAVVASTAHLRDSLRERYSDQPRGKFRFIANGYDETDFDALPRSNRTSARLRIVHAGSINGAFRDPRPVFAALGRLVQKGRLRAGECEIRFVGGGDYGASEEVRCAIEAAGLQESVTLVPRVPYDESLRELTAADLLLLLQASDDTVGLVPAKLYEYLRAGKPVLALVRAGAVSEVMDETGGGWAIDPRAAADVDTALEDAIDAWRTGRLADRRANLDALRRFDRHALAGELAQVFDEATRPSAFANDDISRRLQRS
jgi:glycosyltransferase involved in cell wall biosynthesis